MFLYGFCYYFIKFTSGMYCNFFLEIVAYSATLRCVLCTKLYVVQLKFYPNQFHQINSQRLLEFLVLSCKCMDLLYILCVNLFRHQIFYQQ